MSDARRWDALAVAKGPKRAAWDEPDADGVTECLEMLTPLLVNLHGARVLDLGCGPGRLAVPVALALPDCAVVGVDVSPCMLDGVSLPPNVELRVGDGRSIPGDDTFDAAWCVLMFQHVAGEVARHYIAEVSSRLHHGGRFLFQFAQDAGDRFAFTATLARQWCSEAGLVVDDLQVGAVMAGWCWTTAVQP